MQAFDGGCGKSLSFPSAAQPGRQTGASLLGVKIRRRATVGPHLLKYARCVSDDQVSHQSASSDRSVRRSNSWLMSIMLSSRLRNISVFARSGCWNWIGANRSTPHAKLSHAAHNLKIAGLRAISRERVFPVFLRRDLFPDQASPLPHFDVGLARMHRRGQTRRIASRNAESGDASYVSIQRRSSALPSIPRLSPKRSSPIPPKSEPRRLCSPLSGRKSNYRSVQICEASAVEGSCRLVIHLEWLRFVFANGLVIGEPCSTGVGCSQCQPCKNEGVASWINRD